MVCYNMLSLFFRVYFSTKWCCLLLNLWSTVSLKAHYCVRAWAYSTLGSSVTLMGPYYPAQIAIPGLEMSQETLRQEVIDTNIFKSNECINIDFSAAFLLQSDTDEVWIVDACLYPTSVLYKVVLFVFPCFIESQKKAESDNVYILMEYSSAMKIANRPFRNCVHSLFCL